MKPAKSKNAFLRMRTDHGKGDEGCDTPGTKTAPRRGQGPRRAQSRREEAAQEEMPSGKSRANGFHAVSGKVTARDLTVCV